MCCLSHDWDSVGNPAAAVGNPDPDEHLLTTQLQKSLDNNNVLIQQLNPADESRPQASLDPEGYCHTHGYRVTKKHTSATCFVKASGHKDAATRNNTMGGSIRGKPK